MDTTLNIPLFFILGRERSGTTLLRVTINNHPKIHVQPESPFIMHLYKKYYNNKNINTKQFILDLKKEPFLYNWNIDYEALFKRLQKTSLANFQNYCMEVLNHHQKNNTIIGDKNPTNSLFGNTLHKIFPKAKFIWIIRDYRAQVNSMLNVNFEKKIISSLAARWVGFNKNIEKLQSLYPNQVLLIRYEDFVRSPDEHYQTICGFLHAEYKPLILETNKHNNEFYPKHHKSLGNKINTSHVDEWKTQLTKNQIRICEAVAGRYGEKYGYKKEYNPNFTIAIWNVLGIVYGKCYIPYIHAMYALPFHIKNFINQKIVYRYSTFWKELRQYYKK